MTDLVLNLTKPGDAPKKLVLNLKKAEAFKVRLSWDGGNDLDLHALFAVNMGNGAKVKTFDDVLSTYNVEREIEDENGKMIRVGTLPLAADRTFVVHNGALKHSPDALDGSAEGDDEWMLVHPSLIKVPEGGQIEIPLLAMIHPQGEVTFKNVKNARFIVEKTSGEVLLTVNLSDQFANFSGVQGGSIVLEESGSSFKAVGVGFNTDFNGVVGAFT
ncbi:TerD family protein [Paraburkholderia sp. SIMBA_054]|uniref:TerD family protein n=1 Tax=Paraburkholderia sp. SIMBA_054 TaxID=3085795 RepID=UPI003979D4E4